MKIILLGNQGQLGQSFQHLDSNIIGLNRSNFDQTNINALKLELQKQAPNVLINCLGYTNVDGAESSPDQVFINEIFPQRLSDLCMELNIKLCHFSTDYIFDGQILDCTETTVANPLNAYGKAKLNADQYIMKNNNNYLIFRISSLFSPYKKNIVSTLANILKQGQNLNCISNSIITPTYTPELAKQLLIALKQNIIPTGLYNFAPNTPISPYNLALQIKQELSSQGYPNLGNITPILFEDYKFIANRPKYVILNSNKLSNYINTNQNLKTNLKLTIKE